MTVSRADIRIDHATILTMDEERRIVQDGSLAIVADRIAALGKTKDLAQRWPAKKVIDGRNKLVMPGLINGHSHLGEGYRGLMPDDLITEDWLRYWAYPLKEAITPEDEYWHALNLLAEMIKTGSTCFVDPGLKFLDSTLEAIMESGMRGTTGTFMWDQAGPDAEKCLPSLFRITASEGLKKAETAIKKHHLTGQGRIKVFVTMEGAGTCSDELILGGKALADEYGVHLVTHMATSQEEVEAELKSYGQRPIAHLAVIGALGPNVYLNHMTHVSDEEVRVLADHDVKVSQNPSAALKLAKGITRVGKFTEMLNAGVCLALGTDSSNSSDFRDMFRVLHLAATLPKDARLDIKAVSAEQALEMPTLNGARAIGWETEIGSLESGKKADLIIIDMLRPEWQPCYNVISSLVYSSTGDSVETVIIDGKIVMEARKILTFDEFQVMEKVSQLKASILARTGLKPKYRWKVV